MDFELAAEARDASGRAGSRRLRKTGKVPAVVYGGGQPPSSVTLDHNSLTHQMEHESFYTSILTLKIGKQSESVVIKDVQRHPYRQQIMHMDLLRVRADEAITLQVPVHFLNEETSIGVKTQGGVAEHLMSDVEVSCLPKDLPEYIEVDVSEVKLDDILHLSDLPLPDGVRLPALEHGSDNAVFAIHAPRRAEPETAAEETAEEEETPPETEDDAE
ncbi:MAG TPA: 50S ribosomal protein L25/general stress protein Ctc [Gammaproteobacteria bacterium]|nr:50S ribosomal protein L25/general stress protein Ctc [Gammaproteobacteria bacterium]